MYALMAFGLAAVMILFIATIVAGIILGTVLATMDLMHRVRGTSSVKTRPQETPAKSPA